MDPLVRNEYADVFYLDQSWFQVSLNSQDMDLGDGLSFSRLSEPKLVFVEKEIAQVCECTGVFRAWYFWRMSLLLILIACIVLVDYKMKYFIRGHDMIYGINAYVVFQIIWMQPVWTYEVTGRSFIWSEISYTHLQLISLWDECERLKN